MHDLCSQYVTALKDNIDQHFQHSLPVVPIANPEFVGYGQNDIETLANHFF